MNSSSRDDDDDEIIVRVDNDHQTQTQRISSNRPYLCPCSCSWFSQLLSLFLRSLRIIFLDNPKRFLTIYVFTCLPLSVLLTCQSLSTRALKSHIARLEWVARAADVWVEADNVRDESRHDLPVLLRYKALYGIPILLLSLASFTAAISTTAGKNHRPTLAPAVRAAVTCFVGYLASVACELLSHVAVLVAGVRASAVVVAAAVEVYVMAVVSMGMVVSVAEERYGVSAIRAGWGLMRGRRVVGWVLSGIVLVGSAGIGREMMGVMDGGDWDLGEEWTVRVRYGYMAGLVMMFGWLVLWSYVVFTVFYGDCSNKRNNKRDSSPNGYSSSSSKELEEY